jgi:hypothetical protein
MKINRNFNEFTDFESLELEVPTFCFVTGCVSARRDRRYLMRADKDFVRERPKERQREHEKTERRSSLYTVKYSQHTMEEIETHD